MFGHKLRVENHMGGVGNREETKKNKVPNGVWRQVGPTASGEEARGGEPGVSSWPFLLLIPL